METFDVNAALKRTAGDRKLLGELAAICCQEVPTLLSQLREAVEKRDVTRIAKTAHTLKGAVGAFGPSESFDAAFRLEKLGRGGDLTGVEAAFAELEQVLNRLIPELKKLTG
jgi:HPt (histidine-containing phosphotransfer) domain-containing protein